MVRPLAKKAKKDKQNAVAQAKHDKEKEKAEASKQTKASAILEKLKTPKTALSVIVSRPEFLAVPPSLRSKVEDVFKNFDSMETACKKISTDGAAPLPEGIDSVKDLFELF